MMDFTLGEIAAACCGELFLHGETAVGDCVSSVVIDSRQVTEKGVFLATMGERVDGHKFIASVFEKGAVLAVTQKTPEQVETETGISPEDWGSYLLVEDTLQALKDIAECYRRKLSIPVVGITGSVGKTSTKEFIAGVLSEKYNVLKTDGNYNNEIGVPLTLLRIRGEHTAAVVEMGISDFGEMHRLSKMARPDICVITNIGQCHLENLKTRDGILKAKSEIFDFMAENGQVCLNGEDDKLSTLTEIRGRKPHFFGWGDNPLAEVTAGDIVSHGLWGSDAVLTVRFPQARFQTSIENPHGNSAESPECGAAGMADASTAEQIKVAVQVPLPGRHMVLNSAAAACVARLLGLSPEQIASGIGKIKPVSGRNNLIRLNDYTLIDDCYNANPASMKAALDLLAMADTVKVAILGDMFELGENSHMLHEETGAYAVAAGIHRIYCVGEEAEYMYRAASRRILSSESSGKAGALLSSEGVRGKDGKCYSADGASGKTGEFYATEDASGKAGEFYSAEDAGEKAGEFYSAEDVSGKAGGFYSAESASEQVCETVSAKADVACSGNIDPEGAAAVQAIYFPAKADLLKALERDRMRYFPKGSTVLVKASHGMEFTEIVEAFKNL